MVRDSYRRRFNFKDLRFLYIACLVSIAVVFTALRAGEFYLALQESQAVKAVQIMDEQRDNVIRLERLSIFAQNESGNSSDSAIVRQLLEAYNRVINANPHILEAMTRLESRCASRPCGLLQKRELFPIPTQELKGAIEDSTLPVEARNTLFKQIYNSAVEYRVAIRDTLTLSLEIIRAKDESNLRVELAAYFAIMALLLAQALFVFRPAIRRLNASLATRNDFLSRISHEIRNPMNSILGMADILKTTPLNFEQRRYLDNLTASGNALLEMLNNLVDISVIETGRLKLKEHPFDLFRALDRCLNLIAIQAHHKNLSVYVHIDPQVPNKLFGDSTRLDQVLINLLNNACKFTDQGFIRLSVTLISENETQATLRFCVADSGIGIHAKQLNEVFESFVQGDSSIQRKFGGSGLGLSIAREIVRMMGGNLDVESELGRGARFYFTVSLNKRKPQRPVESSKPLLELQARRLIFVSAREEQAEYEDLIRTMSCACQATYSAHGLREILESHSQSNLDEVLVDDSVGIIAMITARNFAAEFGYGDNTVALIRSNFPKENMDLLRRNGYSRFLIKPLKPWELIDLPPSAAQTPNVKVGDGLAERIKAKQLKVLVVDDSDDNLFLLKEMLEPIAGSIHVAQNGLQGVEKFTEHHYDVVFMDVQMPVMDGYSAIRKIRELEYRKALKTPVFAVTAHSGLVDAEKCIEAGFTDRIVKPISRQDIYRSLAKIFHLEVAEREPADVDTSFPKEILTKLLPTYFRTRSVDLEKIKEALARSDYQNLQKLGHKIKGGAATYGFSNTSAHARELEDAAAAQDHQACWTAVKHLEESLKQKPSG